MRDASEVFQLVHTGLVNAGVDIDTAYRRLLEAGYVPQPQGRFPHEMHVAFWQTLEEVTGDPEIGLHLCPHLPVFRGRVFEYIFLSSANYEQGLHAAFKYQRLVSDAFEVQLVSDRDGHRIEMRGAAGDEPVLRHTETCVAYSFLKAMSVVTDDKFRPTHIRLRADPVAPADEYAAMFRCPVTFINTVTELWLTPELLRCRSPHGDPGLLELHQEYGNTQLEQLARQDLRNDVRAYLHRQFEEGQYDHTRRGPTLSGVAGVVGVSTRHLRFVLSEGGTTFRQMLNEIRFEFACRLLADDAESMEHIASLAGYSEASAFYRAFKKWVGVTPRQYRDEHLSNDGAGRAG